MVAAQQPSRSRRATVHSVAAAPLARSPWCTTEMVGRKAAGSSRRTDRGVGAIAATMSTTTAIPIPAPTPAHSPVARTPRRVSPRLGQGVLSPRRGGWAGALLITGRPVPSPAAVPFPRTACAPSRAAAAALTALGLVLVSGPRLH
ncbi:hypothetical protein ACIA8E_21855 [Streptomyces sp. NPDC051664]|uniref:hypothetical protein n=1 Tax=Streptomyces sp. NPDC051664 TaxID=3365668 RepID=UPI0037A1CA89